MTTKKEQIIVRLSAEKKQQLQEIADDLKIDMSKLIRDKIDEIILENKKSKNSKTSVFAGTGIIKENVMKVATQIMAEEMANEMREEFKKIFFNVMKEEIKATEIIEKIKDK